MAEKKDITRLSKAELVEMLQRQEKMLLNRTFIKSLPDKGEKIYKLVERLKEQITIRERADDLSNRFKRITLSQNMNTGQKIELDSDDDNGDDEDNDACRMLDSKMASITPPGSQQPTPKGISGHPGVSKKPLSEKWSYDSAVTACKPPVFEKTKVISLEESKQLQQQQKEEYEAMRAKQAAGRLMEQITRASRQTNSPSSYEFSSKEAKMKYREEEEEEEEEENFQENEENRESDENYEEQSDED